LGFPSLPGGPADPGRTDELAAARAPVWVYTPPPPRNAWQRWGRNLVLFVLTVASVFLTGVLQNTQTVVIPGRGAFELLNIAAGVRLAAGLLGILMAHEMGHYLACRYYRVDATLPFFIPAPVLSFVGTLGAFIRIRAPIPHRRALFDIGVAGPLAGFAVCLPVLWLGLQEASVIPLDPTLGGVFFGEPLLFQWVARLVHGPLPDGVTLSLGPLGLAAWFGLFVTALNLIPVGQLDGGHVTYALLRRHAHRISRIAWWVCVALVYFGPNWILWAIILKVLGRRHPPTLNDHVPVGRGRVIVGVASLVIFAVCFVPDPVIFSWTDFFEAVGLGHMLGL
jgi:membrane-associated protease RseP (regulator of RpoE activity)